MVIDGAPGRDRTHNMHITNVPLYQLSYGCMLIHTDPLQVNASALDTELPAGYMWWVPPDSNREPDDYESSALTS